FVQTRVNESGLPTTQNLGSSFHTSKVRPGRQLLSRNEPARLEADPRPRVVKSTSLPHIQQEYGCLNWDIAGSCDFASSQETAATGQWWRLCTYGGCVLTSLGCR